MRPSIRFPFAFHVAAQLPGLEVGATKARVFFWQNTDYELCIPLFSQILLSALLNSYIIPTADQKNDES